MKPRCENVDNPVPWQVIGEQVMPAVGTVDDKRVNEMDDILLTRM
jgi:hypothetical protein